MYSRQWRISIRSVSYTHLEAQTEILQCESLNLILQPLVENAIHHGIEEKTDGRGKITVRGWKEDNCVWFMVEDNGVGMEQEVADKILTMESKGYGVRNVDERIRLCYGCLLYTSRCV